MSVRAARVVLALSAAPFAALGTAFLVLPGPMAGLVGVTLTDATADADVRAVYGGLQLGCGLFLGLAAANRAWCRAGIAAQICLYTGLAGARVPSYLLAGVPSALGLALHAGELVGLAAGILVWRGLERHGRAGAA